jgi:hypothetical protein
MNKHPYFGHTLSRDLNPLQIHPISLKAPIVHVRAVIKSIGERRGKCRRYAPRFVGESNHSD